MKIKKIFKYLFTAVTVFGLFLTAAMLSPIFSVRNTTKTNDQVMSSDQQSNSVDYSDKLDYIKNDVEKADKINPIVSIKFADTSLSTNHSAAVVTKEDGSTLLYMWGDNTHGQLGDGTTDPSFIPKLIKNGLEDKKIIQVGLGVGFTGALIDDGSLYMWGLNGRGQLGIGVDGGTMPTPTPVRGFVDKKITQIGVGGEHAGAITDDGKLYMWGNNHSGQLGNETNIGTNNPNSLAVQVDSASFNNGMPTKIALGSFHSGIIAGGNLYTWGFNYNGELGHGANYNLTAGYPLPTKVDNQYFAGNQPTEIAFGSLHSVALAGGKMYAWGNNQDGQLGNDITIATKWEPDVVAGNLSGKTITQIAVGYFHSAALTTDGLYVWGNNDSGELGNNSTTKISSPWLIPNSSFHNKTVAQVTLADANSAVVLNDGSIYMWGNNTRGQLGNGLTVPDLSPKWMQRLGKDSRIKGKSSLVAKEALNEMWTSGNRFDQAGFLNSVELINIANLPDQTYDITEKPFYNNYDRTITMKIKIKYFYNANGYLVNDSSIEALVVEGFKKAKETIIAAKEDYPSDIVTDRWIESVKTDGKIDRSKLETYLTLTYVPNDAVLTISPIFPDPLTGDLNFHINTSKIIDDPDYIDTPSTFTPFIIDLKLTPRITKFESKQIPQLTADALRDILFTNDKLNKTEFEKYQKIIAPADGAEYFLVNDSYKFNTGDGTVEFKIFANKYYDAKSDLSTGSAANPASHFTINMQVKRTATIIKEKTKLPKNIRVDEFVDLVTDNTGIVDDEETLRKFIDISNLPSENSIVIKLLNYTNSTRAGDFVDTVNFNLSVNKYNYTTSVSGDVDKWDNDLSLTLNPRHDPTNVVLKKTMINPDRVDVFKKQIETSVGEELKNYLKNYLDFTSLRDDATVSASIVDDDYDPYNGDITLDINIEKYYEENTHNENPGVRNFLIPMKLVQAPTTITYLKESYSDTRVDLFLNKIANENGEVDLEAFKEYVEINIWEPDVKKLEIDLATVKTDGSSGKWAGDLLIYEANDGENNRFTKRIPLALQLGEKFVPTSITRSDNYDEQILTTDFISTLFDDQGVGRVPIIYDYFEIASKPENAQIKLLDHKLIDENAQVWMQVEVTSYYDENSMLKQPGMVGFVPLTYTTTFDLLSPETNLHVKDVYNNLDSLPRVDRLAARIKSYTSTADLKSFISDYVNLDYLPVGAELSIDKSTFSYTDIPGVIKFDLLTDRYFDANGYLQYGIKPFSIVISDLPAKYESTSISAKTNLPAKLQRVDRFIAALGASPTSPEITNFDVLNEYVDVVSLPVDAKLSVDYSKPITQEKDTGKLAFWIKADKYYLPEDPDLGYDGEFEIVLNLGIVHNPTTINAKQKGNYDNAIRVDRFLRTFINRKDNMVINMDILQQYVDIVSLPAAADLFVGNPKIEHKTGKITFDLIASQYYEPTDSDLITDSLAAYKNPFKISLELAPQMDPTNFVAKPVLPNDILVNELTEYIMPDGVIDQSRFDKYIETQSLPFDAKITLEEMSHSITTGKITYAITVNQYYDDFADLHINSKIFTVVLNLNKLYEETKIYALSAYPNDLDVVTFKQYVQNARGDVLTQNLTKFVGIESLPPTSILTIHWGDETATTIDFIINASHYYSAEHRLGSDKDYEISLSFTNTATETNIKAWDEYPFSNSIMFFETIKNANGIDFTQLSKYVDFTTAPYDATLTISKEHINPVTGVVSFEISTSAWYDANLQPQNSTKTFKITLNLAPRHAETNLYGIAPINISLSLEEFWLLISSNNALDFSKLGYYVNLESLAENTNMQYLNPVKNSDGSISFDLIVDRFYDADGIENFGRKVFKITLSHFVFNQYTQKITDLTWVYIVVAFVVLISGGLIWFLVAKNKNKKESQIKSK